MSESGKISGVHIPWSAAAIICTLLLALIAFVGSWWSSTVETRVELSGLSASVTGLSANVEKLSETIEASNKAAAELRGAIFQWKSEVERRLDALERPRHPTAPG